MVLIIVIFVVRRRQQFTIFWSDSLWADCCAIPKFFVPLESSWFVCLHFDARDLWAQAVLVIHRDLNLRIETHRHLLVSELDRLICQSDLTSKLIDAYVFRLSLLFVNDFRRWLFVSRVRLCLHHLLDLCSPVLLLSHSYDKLFRKTPLALQTQRYLAISSPVAFVALFLPAWFSFILNAPRRWSFRLWMSRLCLCLWLLTTLREWVFSLEMPRLS